MSMVVHAAGGTIEHLALVKMLASATWEYLRVLEWSASAVVIDSMVSKAAKAEHRCCHGWTM